MYIGEVARRTGCTVEIIRYYEKRGLVPAPGRASSGYRLYSDDHVGRLRFIRGARALGFSLSEIEELISLSTQTEKSCEVVDEIARRHLRDIRERIAALQGLEHELARVADGCDGGRIPECRILEHLELAHLKPRAIDPTGGAGSDQS